MRQDTHFLRLALPPGTKSDHLNCLRDMSDAKPDAFVVVCVVLVGAAFVQMLKHVTAKTFDGYMLMRSSCHTHAQNCIISCKSTRCKTGILQTP